MDPTQVIRDPDGVMRCRECGFRYDLDPQQIADRAGSAFTAVSAALAGVPLSDRHLRPSPSVWSVNAYTFHLATAAEVISSRIRAIVEQERPPIPYYDQDEEAERSHTDEHPADESLARLGPAVESFRSYILALDPSAWDRVGMHECAGEVRLAEIAQDMPHELQHHAADIRRVGEEVRGPE